MNYLSIAHHVFILTQLTTILVGIRKKMLWIKYERAINKRRYDFFLIRRQMLIHAIFFTVRLEWTFENWIQLASWLECLIFNQTNDVFIFIFVAKKKWNFLDNARSFKAKKGNCGKKN